MNGSREVMRVRRVEHYKIVVPLLTASQLLRCIAGVLEEKWREAKGEDACFAGPVGVAGAFRLSTLRL